MKRIFNFFVFMCAVVFMVIGFAYAESVVDNRAKTNGNYDPIPINSQIAQEAISKVQYGINTAPDSDYELETISTVVIGTIEGWPESGYIFLFDDYVSIVSEIQAWWSINQLSPDRGWFYGYNSSTEVSHVTGITDICEITDASIYSYSNWSVGPVDEGDFVLFHNVDTDYYAAFRVDDIYGSGALDSYLDTTWYLQEDGSPDFSGFCSSGICYPQLSADGLPTMVWPLEGDQSDYKWYKDQWDYEWKFGSCGREYKRHVGLDISLKSGETIIGYPVYPVYAGEVKAVYNAGRKWGYGVTIEHVDHNGDKFTTNYTHINPEVSVGADVLIVDKIGKVANIPSKGDHLHFSIRRAAYSNIANRGALPTVDEGDCKCTDNKKRTDPVFPEYFIDPALVTYE